MFTFSCFTFGMLSVTSGLGASSDDSRICIHCIQSKPRVLPVWAINTLRRIQAPSGEPRKASAPSGVPGRIQLRAGWQTTKYKSRHLSDNEPTITPIKFFYLLISQYTLYSHFALNPVISYFVMSYTIYEASIEAATHVLTALDGILSKAEKHPDAASFPSRKLADDMLPLSFQIWTVCKLAEAQARNLQQIQAVSEEYNNELSTFPEMHSRIKEALDMLKTVDKDQVLKTADTKGPIDFGRNIGKKEISPTAFCAGVGIPNMYFHISMAYAILRNAGVELGKLDYLAPFFISHVGM